MKPVWKWILGIFAVLIIAIVSVSWYFNSQWKPLVEDKLKSAVFNATDGLYVLKYEDLALNLTLGNVSLSNVELIPDTTVYAKMELAKKAPDNYYHIKLKSLKIKRFSIMDVLSHKKLNIKAINFENPYVHLSNKYHAYNDTLANKSNKTLYDGVKDILSAINVRDISVDNIEFKYSKLSNGKSSDFNVKNINIKVHDVLIDETSITDTTRFFYTKMVDIDVPGFEYALSDGFYMVKFDALKINTKDQNIMLTNVDYKPKMNKSAYFKQRGKNITMAVMHFDTLRMEQLNFKKLIEDKQVLMKAVQIKNGFVKLANDKRYPKTPINQVGSSPHQKLMKLKQLLYIDSVLLDNIDIEYDEFSAKFAREGKISFSKANGVITNVTNDTLLLNKDKFMRADLKAKVNNSGNMHVQFGFDMLSKSGYHTYKGTLGGMQATSFNKILQPLLNVEIASGNIQSISFNMEGTDHRNWGDFRFKYNDLKISLLNKPGEEKGKSSKKIISFLVNKLIINDSNPDANGVYHIGKVSYTRVPSHSFFKTMWQSLLDGIKQTAGISAEREAQLMGTAETAQEGLKETKSAVKKTKGFIKGLFKKDKENEN